MPDAPRRIRSRFARLVLVALAVYVVARLLAGVTGWPALTVFARLAGGCCLLLVAAWIARSLWRRLFWSVGRRLAFSYVLVGVLPLGLIALLGLVSAYLLSGLLLGHLSRDAVAGLRDELEAIAIARLEQRGGGEEPLAVSGGLRTARYAKGRKVDGPAAAPVEWPAWLAAGQASRAHPDGDGRRRPFVALASGAPTLAAVAGDGERGSLVWLEGDVAALLRERTRSWFQLYRTDDPRKLPVTRIQVGGRVLSLRGLWLSRPPEETREFYRLSPPADPQSPAWRDRPLVLWMERTEALRALATGAEVADGVAISLAASPRGLFRALLSTSEQVDSTAWIALVGIAVLLFEIWAVAAVVAVVMIFGLSRAVNRLSRATETVSRGDFSVRIPVRRRDQLGDLQRSFNDMTEHLSELVGTAAQKEVLDKELALARQVQRDLLPDTIRAGERFEIATHFQPSAAIGGDYFDVLERPDGRLAVVIADVAGHGLAAGLRMAMVKSALELMVEEGRPAPEILSRLGRLLRRRQGERSFVTLALAELDPATGELELTNAGHPPCYVVRADGAVDEILVPGVPLGALAGAPGHARLTLAAGEGVVFLSDGFIETVDGEGEMFGFERVRACLAGGPAEAQVLLDRLLGAVLEHAGRMAAEDDRTGLAVVYRPGRPARPEAASSDASPSRPKIERT